MERLSPLDSAFLLAEDENADVSLAIASVTVLEGPAPSLPEVIELFTGRLPEIPRLRQKVRTVPLDLLPPAWVDDPDFDITTHIRREVLPTPGDDDALCDLVGEVMSQRLDRDRALWDAVLVDGLSDGRWALLIKLHHCMADGVSGAHLFDVLSDDHTVAGPVSPFVAADAIRSLVQVVTELASYPVAQARVLARALSMPVRFAEQMVSTLQGLASYGKSLLPTSPSSLVGPIGRLRSYRVARSSLSTVRDVAHMFKVTVNDVVLSVIAGAFRTLLLKRGEEPSAATIRAAVPVSIRADGTRHVMSNQISAMLPMLPVEIEDPVRRLTAVHSRLSQLKSGRQSSAGAAMTSLAGYEFFGPVAWLVRLLTHLPQRSVVTVTTNVPGPRRALRMLGRRVIEIFPYVPIAFRLRTGISVLTYADRVAFGVTADRSTAPEVDLMADAIEREIAELAEAASQSPA